jgi:hypothetical protein
MDLWTGANFFFSIGIILSLLVMLYAMALMSRSIRLLQYQTSVIENDIKLIGEEIKMITSQEAQKLSNVKPVNPD